MDSNLIIGLLASIVTFIIVFISLYFINDLKGKGSLLFGIRIPKSYIDDSRLITIKNKYKINLTIIASILFILSLAFISRIEISISILTLGLIIASTILYYISYKKVLTIKNSEDWTSLTSKKVYISMNTKREENLVSLWWYVVPFIFVAVNFIIVLMKINNLPLQTPMHFGFTGPDNFADGRELSTKLNVLILPALNLFITLTFFFSVKNTARSNEKLNGGKPEEIAKINSTNKKNLSQLCISLALVTSFMFCYLSAATVELIKVNMIILLIVSFIPLIISAISIPIFIKSNNKKENTSIEGKDNNDIYMDDDTPYKVGGLIYYNKNNPSTFVPKRMGIGFTINFATLGGKIFLLVLLGLLIFLSCMPLFSK